MPAIDYGFFLRYRPSRCKGLFALIALLALAEAVMSPLAAAQPPGDSALSTAGADSAGVRPDEIWRHLQQSEEILYVVLLRHAVAPGVGDPANFSLGDCDTQRNLSAEGRAQARQIGLAFRARNVGVRHILSSQWCRCRETAELMSVGEVTPFPPLNSFFRERGKAAARTAELEHYLLSQAEDPGVIVMVTHQVNITALTGIVPRSGDAVVLRVDSTGLTPMGELSPAD